MTKENNTMIDEVLDEILLSETEPNHEALTIWIKKYPCFRDELTSFFSTWAIQEELPTKSAIDENRIANHMVSHALDLIHQRERQASEACARLGDAIKATGQTDDEVAGKCKLDFSIIAKLDRRLIRFESIPQLCITLLSAATNQSPEFIARLLQGGPVQLKPTFKSKKKPVSQVEDFVDAVKSSELTEDVKDEWLQLLSDDQNGKVE